MPGIAKKTCLRRAEGGTWCGKKRSNNQTPKLDRVTCGWCKAAWVRKRSGKKNSHVRLSDFARLHEIELPDPLTHRSRWHHRLQWGRTQAKEHVEELWDLWLAGWRLEKIAELLPGVRPQKLAEMWRDMGYPVSYQTTGRSGLRGAILREIARERRERGIAWYMLLAAALEVLHGMSDEKVLRLWEKWRTRTRVQARAYLQPVRPKRKGRYGWLKGLKEELDGGRDTTT